MKILLLSLFLLSHPTFAKTVVLLGQHHLLSGTKTVDIKKSSELPQYLNQKTIYLILDEWIEGKKLDLVIAEGCEGEIDQNFKLEFNGWNYNSLQKMSKLEQYEDILTMIPLKIEAKYKEQIKTICADNLALIKEHQMIFSELNGYIGFYTRLKENKSNPKKYSQYLKALEKVEGRAIKEPLVYLKLKILKLIAKEEEFIQKRNQSFLKVINETTAKTIALIIGDRHIPSLKKNLEDKGIKVQLVDLVQETLPQLDLIKSLKQEFK